MKFKPGTQTPDQCNERGRMIRWKDGRMEGWKDVGDAGADEDEAP
jgi:hypothetical protein